MDVSGKTGTDRTGRNGSELVRSAVVAGDRYGSQWKGGTGWDAAMRVWLEGSGRMGEVRQGPVRRVERRTGKAELEWLGTQRLESER